MNIPHQSLYREMPFCAAPARQQAMDTPVKLEPGGEATMMNEGPLMVV